MATEFIDSFGKIRHTPDITDEPTQHHRDS